MMDKGTKIKFLKIVDATDLSGEMVIVDFETGKYFLFRGTARDIWDKVRDGVTVQEIVKQLMKEYDVKEEFCTEQVITFLNKLIELGFICEM